MIVTGSIKQVKNILNEIKNKEQTIGFVPTMGYLHKGHLSLIKRARKECGFLVVSVFVNPIQFGPNEDFERYPRNIKADRNLLKMERVNLLFSPPVNMIFHPGHSAYIDETTLSKTLCGKSRPGHFRGVCTVVVKLFNIIRPDIAYLGQKDYQQALIIKKLTRDLNLDIKIKILPIIRESDNLAMSSRNIHLKGAYRKDSVCLFEALSAAKELISEGERSTQVISNRMRRIIMSKKSATIDYIKIVDAYYLKDVDIMKGKILIALAVYINDIRLIDNHIINVKS